MVNRTLKSSGDKANSTRKMSYDNIGLTYAAERRTDPRIEGRIHHKLSDFKTVLNVGAGTGSYEPMDRFVASLDPSIFMLRSRPLGAAPCVQGEAEALPFMDAVFDCAMAILTIHHWSNWEKGIREALRVSRGPVVIVTWDPAHAGFWLTQDYLNEIAAIDSRKFPPLEGIRERFENVIIEPIPIPWDCTDGFLGAYWQRPEAYLDDSKRKSISSLALSSSLMGLERLSRDLSNGAWEKRYGYLRGKTELDVGYRMVVLANSSCK